MRTRWKVAAVLALIAGTPSARAQFGPAPYTGYPAPPAMPYPAYPPPPGMPCAGCPVPPPPCPMPAPDANPPPILHTFWLQADYQTFLINKGPLSTPLVTTTPVVDPTVSQAAIGQPGTTVLYGQDGLTGHALTGYHLGGGINLTEQSWGDPWTFEWNYFFAEQRSNNYAGLSDGRGTPVLARPVFLTQFGAEGSFISSYPGLSAGAITVTSESRLWGTDEFFAYTLYASPFASFEFLTGFRYLAFDETITILSTASPLNPVFGTFFDGKVFGVGNTTTVRDQFRTTNDFIGGELGLRFTLVSSDLFTGLSVNFTAKAGVGVTDRVIENNGVSTLQGPTGVTVANGGVLAVPSNSVRTTSTRFTVLPEGLLTVNYDLNTWARLTLGASTLWWSNVVRPGNVINRNVDTEQAPTDASFNPGLHPSQQQVQFKDSQLFVQGFTAGLIFTY